MVVAENHCKEGNAVFGEYIVRLRPLENTAAFISGKMTSHAKSWSSKSLAVQFKSPPTEGATATSFKLSSESLQPIESVLAFAKSNQELLAISSDPDVISVESNCTVHTMAIRLPNDPDLLKNWALALIGVPQAWALQTDSEVIIAVPDTGVDIGHSDLAQNIWTNSAELNGRTGIDDDGNGYIDDIYGWGFPEKNNDVTPGSYPGAEHGTHISGIIGAVGNNGIGSAGVLWKTKIMALRPFKKSTEEATTADLIESIYYAVNNGAQVINCSWGSEQTPTKAELDVYAYAEAHGVVVVAAAGNESKDASVYSPANLASVFAVGSINSQRILSTFSSYGSKIGLLAPGGDAASSFGIGKNEGIYSTLPGNKYGERSGTSMSAPFVTSLAAMIKTILPKISPSETRRLLKDGGDKITLKVGGLASSYSIINMEKTVSMAAEVSRSNPQCSENCALSTGSTEMSSLAPIGEAKFGGGCAFHASLNATNSKTASSSWDLAILLCFLFPTGRLLFRNKKSRDQSDLGF